MLSGHVGADTRNGFRQRVALNKKQGQCCITSVGFTHHFPFCFWYFTPVKQMNVIVNIVLKSY